MTLAPFLVVLVRRDDGGDGCCRWRSYWRSGVRIRIDGDGRGVGHLAEDGQQTGDDDEERPAVVPGEDVEGVQQEEDADQKNPDRAADGVEEALPVGRGAV